MLIILVSKNKLNNCSTYFEIKCECLSTWTINNSNRCLFCSVPHFVNKNCICPFAVFAQHLCRDFNMLLKHYFREPVIINDDGLLINGINLFHIQRKCNFTKIQVWYPLTVSRPSCVWSATFLTIQAQLNVKSKSKAYEHISFTYDAVKWLVL